MLSRAAAVTVAGVLAAAGLATGSAHATAEPSVDADRKCGAVTLTANNPTSQDDLLLQYQVDSEEVRTIPLGPNDTHTVPIRFREDSGDHVVRWRVWGGSYRDLRGHWDSTRVESDCRPNRARPGEPTIKQPECGVHRGTLVLPAVHGIVYKVNGRPYRPGEHELRPGRYVITAHAVGGWRLVGVHLWERWVKPSHCHKTAKPAKPELTQPSCDVRTASLAIPRRAGVIYRTGAAVLKQGLRYALAPGAFVVTAEPAQGYRFPESAQTRWDFTAKAAPTCKPPAPQPWPDTPDNADRPQPVVPVVNDVPVPTRVDTGLGGLARH